MAGMVDKKVSRVKSSGRYSKTSVRDSFLKGSHRKSNHQANFRQPHGFHFFGGILRHPCRRVISWRAFCHVIRLCSSFSPW